MDENVKSTKFYGVSVQYPLKKDSLQHNGRVACQLMEKLAEQSPFAALHMASMCKLFFAIFQRSSTIREKVEARVRESLNKIEPGYSSTMFEGNVCCSLRPRESFTFVLWKNTCIVECQTTFPDDCDYGLSPHIDRIHFPVQIDKETGLCATENVLEASEQLSRSQNSVIQKAYKENSYLIVTNSNAFEIECHIYLDKLQTKEEMVFLILD